MQNRTPSGGFLACFRNVHNFPCQWVSFIGELEGRVGSRWEGDGAWNADRDQVYRSDLGAGKSETYSAARTAKGRLSETGWSVRPGEEVRRSWTRPGEWRWGMGVSWVWNEGKAEETLVSGGQKNMPEETLREESFCLYTWGHYFLRTPSRSHLKTWTFDSDLTSQLKRRIFQIAFLGENTDLDFSVQIF